MMLRATHEGVNEKTKVGQKFQEARWDLLAKKLFPRFACGLFYEGINM